MCIRLFDITTLNCDEGGSNPQDIDGTLQRIILFFSLASLAARVSPSLSATWPAPQLFVCVFSAHVSMHTSSVLLPACLFAYQFTMRLGSLFPNSVGLILALHSAYIFSLSHDFCLSACLLATRLTT